MSLGSLIVRLSMDTASFDTDAGRAAKIADKRAKEIDASFKKAGAAIGAALVAGVATAATVLKGAVDRMDELSKASQKVQMPTEEFSRLAYAGELADVSMETLVSSMGRLTKAQAAALDPASKQAEVFGALGIAVTDAEGKLRSSSDVLADFADKFQAMQGSPEAMAAGFAIFGKSFQDLIPLIKDGSAGLREAAAESDALGKTLSTEAGQAAEEFNDNLTRLQGMIQGVVMDLAGDMLPTLVDITQGLLDSAKEGGELHDILEGMVSVVDGVGAAFGGAVSLVSAFGNALDELGVHSAQSKTGLDDLARTIGDVGRLLGSFGDRIGGGIDQLVGTVTGDASLKAKGVYRQRQALQAGRRALYGLPDFSNVSSDPSFAGVRGGADSVGAGGADLGRLRGVFGGGARSGGRGGGASRAPQLTEEQKAAQQLAREYENLTARMDERIALFGVESEAGKTAYEIEHGSLKNLTQAQKDALMAQAEQMDMLEKNAEAKRKKAEEDERLADAQKRQKEQLGEVVAGLQEEQKLLGMTALEQEKYLAVKQAGVAAYGDEAKAIENLVEQNTRLREMHDLADDVGGAFADMFVDISSGTKSVKDAFQDMIKQVTEMIIRFLLQKAVEQFAKYLFGASGGGVGGYAEGGYVKGFAGGGYTGAGGKYQPAGIVHAGEYVINADSTRKLGLSYLNRLNSYASGGAVTPVTAGTPVPAGGTAVTINQSFNIEKGGGGAGNADSDRFRLTMAKEMEATARRVITQEQRQGGSLWRMAHG